VPSQQLVGLDADVEILWQLRGRSRLRGAVRNRVAFRLRSVTEPEQRPQAIGLQREVRDLAGEQEDLFRARFSDGRELSQRLRRVSRRSVESGVEVPAKLLQGDGRDLSQPLGAIQSEDAAPGDLHEERLRSREDPRRNQARLAAEEREGVRALRVIGQVSDVFPEDQLEGVRRRLGRRAVQRAQRVEDAAQARGRSSRLSSPGHAPMMPPPRGLPGDCRMLDSCDP